jgi:hypothetical protein
MAKKDKKKKDKQKSSDAAEAVEAVRSAVERTFQATTEGAAGTSKRTRALVDEVAHAASRIRETIEDLKILEDVRGLRADIEGLARRVAALEIRQGKSAPAATPSRPAPAKRTAARKPAAKRSSAKRAAKTRAKPSARAKAARAKARAKTAPAKPAGTSS